MTFLLQLTRHHEQVIYQEVGSLIPGWFPADVNVRKGLDEEKLLV